MWTRSLQSLRPPSVSTSASHQSLPNSRSPKTGLMPPSIASAKTVSTSSLPGLFTNSTFSSLPPTSISSSAFYSRRPKPTFGTLKPGLFSRTTIISSREAIRTPATCVNSSKNCTRSAPANSTQWINFPAEVWHNFWDTRLTYQHAYLARLNYVHRNAVKHTLVPVANQYRWCSASWFERVASPAQVKTIYRMKIDRVNVPDDF